MGSPWPSQACRVSTAANFLSGEMLKYKREQSTEIIYTAASGLDAALTHSDLFVCLIFLLAILLRVEFNSVAC